MAVMMAAAAASFEKKQVLRIGSPLLDTVQCYCYCELFARKAIISGEARPNRYGCRHRAAGGSREGLPATAKRGSDARLSPRLRQSDSRRAAVRSRRARGLSR